MQLKSMASVEEDKKQSCIAVEVANFGNRMRSKTDSFMSEKSKWFTVHEQG